MKSLKNFILEDRKHVDTATVADFYEWSCLGELPSGKCEKTTIKPENCEGLLQHSRIFSLICRAHPHVRI